MYSVSTGPNDQEGPQEIKIMIVNHCLDCNKVNFRFLRTPINNRKAQFTNEASTIKVEGHFDINNSPGWNNPQIWWKPLDASECR